jgi:transposase-like protein
LKADPSDLIKDLRKSGQEFDKLQANFSEGLHAPSTVGKGGGLGGTAAAATGAAAGLGKAATQAGLLGTAMRGLKGLGPALGIAGVGYTVIGLGRSMAKNTTQMESWRRQFEVLGLSAGEANAELSKTIDFASATILDTDAVIQARMQLKYLGLDSQRALTAIADAAQLSGVSINSLAEAMGRVQAGDMTGGLRQLRRFGITSGGVEARAAELGGGAGANVQAALEAIESKFGGATDTLSSTAESMVGTFKNEWLKSSAEIGKSFEPVTKLLLEGATGLAYAARLILGPIDGLKAAAGTVKDWIRVAKEAIDPRAGLGERALEKLAQRDFGAVPFLNLRGALGPQMQQGRIPEPPAVREPTPWERRAQAEEENRRRQIQEYQAVQQARVVNNYSNYTHYSPVGLGYQTGLAQVAG